MTLEVHALVDVSSILASARVAGSFIVRVFYSTIVGEFFYLLLAVTFLCQLVSFLKHNSKFQVIRLTQWAPTGQIYRHLTTSLNLLTPLADLLTTNLVATSSFLPRYYQVNDLLWQDGFLIDFLQKKLVDKWTRKFLIYSGYLFNERLVFDWVIRFYIDLVIWSTYRVMIYEFTNVASTLVATLFLFLVLYLVFALGYVSVLLF